MLFHEGDLQSGISVALQESKSVICFVRDDSEESDKWETQWLQDQNIPNVLERQAVVLRLEAGSQEASYLSVFCPVETFPTLLVIHQGQLIDQLNAGTNKNEFTLRLLNAMNSKGRPSVPQAQVSQPPIESQASQATSSTTTPPETEPEPPSPEQPTQSDPQPSSTPPQPIQTLLSDRRIHLESQRAAQAAAEKAKAAERSKARLQESSSTPTGAPSDPSTASGARSRENYAAQQVQRKREAKQERERVLRLLENDRIERKEREERRKAQLQAERLDVGESSPLPGAAAASREQTRPATPSTSASANNSRCALQVRLLNGSTLRSTFAANDTLSGAVRTWIDTSRTDGDAPYTLKQILTPLPSRTLSDSDEARALADVDLAPSATLVLVSVKKTAASAYGGRGGGQDSQLSGYLMAWLASIVNMTYAILGLGGRAEGAGARAEGEERTGDSGPAEGRTTATPAANAAAPAPASAAGGAGIRIRTLRDQRVERDDDQQLYNGNQLNFEPNRNDRAGDGVGEEEGNSKAGK